MLEKLYGNKTEKELFFFRKLYTALLIVVASLLVVFNGISYFLWGNFHLIPSIIFIIVLFWSALNVDYLKKKV
ncbi:conserved hypothetical protein [Flavobacterium sp. 9R]|nr:conserved hypothetical protein [Flavobacterium sp. 9R]